MNKLKLVFVTSGVGVPYTPLEESICNALKQVVNQLIILRPNDPNLESEVIKYRPDALLVFQGLSYPCHTLKKICEHGISTVVWFTDDPYYTDWTRSIAPHFDYVFTQDIGCVDFYTSLGCKSVQHLPLGVDLELFHPRKVDAKYYSDIAFIGNGFENRIALIDDIAPFLKQKKSIIIGLWWDRLKNYSILKDKVRLNQWLPPQKTAYYYSGAKVVINLHRGYSNVSHNHNSMNKPALSINNRTFEIAACGAFQLTDIREDLDRHYKIGKEIEVFRSAEELIKKAEYYLKREDKRTRIAMRGMEKTVAKHSYLHRISQLVELLLRGKSGG